MITPLTVFEKTAFALCKIKKFLKIIPVLVRYKYRYNNYRCGLYNQDYTFAAMFVHIVNNGLR